MIVYRHKEKGIQNIHLRMFCVVEKHGKDQFNRNGTKSIE